MNDDTGQKAKPARTRKKAVKPVLSISSAKPMVHDLIGHKLRAYYAGITSEPVPDRFAALLGELEARTAPKKPVS